MKGFRDPYVLRTKQKLNFEIKSPKIPEEVVETDIFKGGELGTARAPHTTVKVKLFNSSTGLGPA